MRASVVFCALIVFPALESGAADSEPDASNRRPAQGGEGTSERTSERTTWDSVYTVEQAARGEKTYGETCARCHRATLGGGDEAPALTGSGFMSSWSGQTLHELHERVRTTMPTDTPAVYSRQQVTDAERRVTSLFEWEDSKMWANAKPRSQGIQDFQPAPC